MSSLLLPINANCKIGNNRYKNIYFYLVEHSSVINLVKAVVKLLKKEQVNYDKYQYYFIKPSM